MCGMRAIRAAGKNSHSNRVDETKEKKTENHLLQHINNAKESLQKCHKLFDESKHLNSFYFLSMQDDIHNGSSTQTQQQHKEEIVANQSKTEEAPHLLTTPTQPTITNTNNINEHTLLHQSNVLSNPNAISNQLQQQVADLTASSISDESDESVFDSDCEQHTCDSINGSDNSDDNDDELQNILNSKDDKATKQKNIHIFLGGDEKKVANQIKELSKEDYDCLYTLTDDTDTGFIKLRRENSYRQIIKEKFS